MSNYRVVSAVNKTLRGLLEADFKQFDPNQFPITNDSDIKLEPPFKFLGEAYKPETDCLSIYLYRIEENGDMKNRPMKWREDDRARLYPPLALNLFYLITPLTDDPDKDHKLLARTMQLLNDNAILKGADLRGTLENTTEEIRIKLNPISMEDMTKLWSGFMRPYRLSVSYEVKVIYIDSEREVEAERIRRKRLEFKSIGVQETVP